MSLVLRPNPDGAPDDYHVMQGGWQVGRIHKRQDASRPEIHWFWIISCIFRGPDGLRLSGMNATADQALAALKETWNRWLAWAELVEAKTEVRTGPQVLSVIIKPAQESEC
jgi:hypothetical protein